MTRSSHCRRGRTAGCGGTKPVISADSADGVFHGVDSSCVSGPRRASPSAKWDALRSAASFDGARLVAAANRAEEFARRRR